jgi:peptidoglycan/LPS O-acetylase OafA/YrhL
VKAERVKLLARLILLVAFALFVISGVRLDTDPQPYLGLGIVVLLIGLGLMLVFRQQQRRPKEPVQPIAPGNPYN